MSILAIDLGGTKLAIAVFTEDGTMLREERTPLENRQGGEVGSLIQLEVKKILAAQQANGNEIKSIGISVPGISYQKKARFGHRIFPGGMTILCLPG